MSLCENFPVGELTSDLQLAAELKIAAQRLEIQAGVMRDWANRFYALESAVRQRAAHTAGNSTGEKA